MGHADSICPRCTTVQAQTLGPPPLSLTSMASAMSLEQAGEGTLAGRVGYGRESYTFAAVLRAGLRVS